MSFGRLVKQAATGWFNAAVEKPKTVVPATLLAAVGVYGAAVAGVGSTIGQYTWSDGTDIGRIGTVTKLSKKGFLCKTWEGELAMSNFSRDGSLMNNRGTDNTFYFSVPKEDIAAKIMDAARQGSTVGLLYKQKLFAIDSPFYCQRRTEYEIVDVRQISQESTRAPMAPVELHR